MAYGIKVSKKGFDVIKDESEIKPNIAEKQVSQSDDYHLLQTLGLAYFYGAKLQLVRYREISSKLESEQVDAVLKCLHEFSCLLEDLVTVSKYLGKCGKQHKLNSLIVDMRNHIRHDIREQFDDESDCRKIQKLKSLKIPDHLQTYITFDVKYVRIGDKQLSLVEIKDYLDWVEKNMIQIFDEAYDKRYIKERFWANGTL